jgi:hypothetical protein
VKMSPIFGGFAVLLLIASPWVDPSAAWMVYTMGATCAALALILHLFND